MARWLSWLERRPVTAEVAGSSPAWVVQYGILAQLGEHLPYKQRVTGSSPVGPTYKTPMWLNLREAGDCVQDVRINHTLMQACV